MTLKITYCDQMVINETPRKARPHPADNKTKGTSHLKDMTVFYSWALSSYTMESSYIKTVDQIQRSVSCKLFHKQQSYLCLHPFVNISLRKPLCYSK